jgi:hypothetical protein
LQARFDGQHLRDAQRGAARYRVRCDLYDDDTFSDDLLETAVKSFEPNEISPVVEVSFSFRTNAKHLEPPYEKVVEFLAKCKLTRDGARVGPWVESNVLDFKLPDPPPAPPPPDNGRRIEASVSGVGLDTVVTTNGRGFKSGNLAVVKITDKNLRQFKGIATVSSNGTFSISIQYPCVSGTSYTITAREDENPAGTFANTIERSCG